MFVSVVELGRRLGVRPASQLRPAAGGFIPGPSEWTALWDGPGIRRGSLLSVEPLSLVAALMGSATRAGLWCAEVGVPELSPAAAAKAGVVLDRCVFVDVNGQSVPAALGALMEGVEVIVVGSPSRLSAVATRQIAARARTSGTVLIGIGAWAGVDLSIRVIRSSWSGMSGGYGRLRRRTMRLGITGRRVPRPRFVDVEWNVDGQV